jgi:hypothetical protein
MLVVGTWGSNVVSPADKEVGEDRSRQGAQVEQFRGYVCVRVCRVELGGGSKGLIGKASRIPLPFARLE